MNKKQRNTIYRQALLQFELDPFTKVGVIQMISDTSCMPIGISEIEVEKLLEVSLFITEEVGSNSFKNNDERKTALVLMISMTE